MSIVHHIIQLFRGQCPLYNLPRRNNCSGTFSIVHFIYNCSGANVHYTPYNTIVQGPMSLYSYNTLFRANVHCTTYPEGTIVQGPCPLYTLYTIVQVPMSIIHHIIKMFRGQCPFYSLYKIIEGQCPLYTLYTIVQGPMSIVLI